MNNDSSMDIAITGISIKFPGASSLDEFKANIYAGVDSAGSIPKSRIDELASYIKAVDRNDEVNFKKGAYINRISDFDYKFYNITLREAISTHPAQRLFLDCAVLAAEDAGYGLSRIAQTETGVFVGHISQATGVTYNDIINVSEDTVSATGTIDASIAGRVSYFLNLIGPSVVVDTACSSSFAALNAAINSIYCGECSQAIVGGVQIDVFPEDVGVEIGIESQDGHTYPFDGSHSGTGEGEGVAAIFIKPLEEALDDHDHIYGIIKAVSVNQDGRSIGLSAPNPLAQVNLICSSLSKAKLKASDIDYAEFHGTGTKVGDPVEYKAATEAFKRCGGEKGKCSIGSVKANINHLYACSGLAGLIKCCMIMSNQYFPPQINIVNINKEIKLEGSLFRIDRERRRRKTDHKLCCSVSNFGFSGTNFHAILEEAEHFSSADDGSERLFILSAATRSALADSVLEMALFIKRHRELSLNDICYTMACREQFRHRLAFIVSSVDELIDRLSNFDFTAAEATGVFCGKARDAKEMGTFGFLTPAQKRAAVQSINEMLQDEKKLNLNHIARLFVAGVNADIGRLFDNAYKQHLPGYQFEKCRCWPEIK